MKKLLFCAFILTTISSMQAYKFTFHNDTDNSVHVWANCGTHCQPQNIADISAHQSYVFEFNCLEYFAVTNNLATVTHNVNICQDKHLHIVYKNPKGKSVRAKGLQVNWPVHGTGS